MSERNRIVLALLLTATAAWGQQFTPYAARGKFLLGPPGSGNAGLAGNDGDDLMIGGLGEDTIQGADGDDTLRGGGGRDTLVGDQGIDVLNGNGGNDLGVTGEGIDPTPIRVEIIDESFRLSAAMLLNLDGI